MRPLSLGSLLRTASLLLSACAAEPATSLDEAAGETGLAGPLDAIPDDEAKFDTAGATGPRIAAGASTEVWAATNAWDDRDTTAARRAGLAWGENSGLDWEQKYDAWLASLTTTPRAAGGTTFRLRTPYGDRTLDAPNLECAEVALMMRALFASWYALPFYITGWDSAGRQSLYAGHFGFVNASGARVGSFPTFKTSYRDHTSSWRAGQAWPRDERLRGYRLGTDDGNASLGGAGAGAYLDELLLNKRVGYFLRLLLLYFGSVNLADGANMFHVMPESIAAGDVLLERWQKRGIGHTLPVLRVEEPAAGRFSVSIATGSMPRRQPVWESGESVRWYFTMEETGGEGQNSAGDRYAALGGGIRRWRTAKLVSGRWSNVVRTADVAAYIPDADLARIAARPTRFGEILARVSPEEQRNAALAAIESARSHLRSYPASCSARTRREEAFSRLYTVMQEFFGETRAEVDATHRALADYVFAELTYEQSRTCCWNSTTAEMGAVILDLAAKEQTDAEAAGVCAAPSVFRSEPGTGYGRWADYAASTGRGSSWRAWSEDEPCAQRGVAEDAVAPTDVVAWCERTPAEPPAPGCTDAMEPNDDRAAARATTGPDTFPGLKICAGDSDWFRIDAPAGTPTTVRISFRHADGDLDMEAVNESGTRLSSSEGTSDTETVTATGTFYVRVFGYAGAVNAYTLTVSR